MGDGGSRHRKVDAPDHRRSGSSGRGLPARQAVSNGGISNRRTTRSASTQDEIQPGSESLLIVYVVVALGIDEYSNKSYIEKVRAFKDEKPAREYAFDQLDDGKLVTDVYSVEVEGTEEGVKA